MDNGQDHERTANVTQAAPAPRRPKRRRDRTRHNKHNASNAREDHDMNGDDEETKRLRVEDQQQKLLPLHPMDLYQLLTELKTTAPQHRQYQEVALYGTTPAVVGPGYEVRELLFGEETVSFHISASVTQEQVAMLRDVPAHGVLAKALRGAMVHVEHYKIDTVAATETAATGALATSAAASAMAKTSYSVVVHLLSKDHVASFRDVIKPLAAAVSEFKVEPFNVRSPLEAPWRPEVIKMEPLASFVSVTWATGPETGSARLKFHSPIVANAFIQSFSRGDMFRLPNGLGVKLVGSGEGEAIVISVEGRGHKGKQTVSSLPPLKRFHYGDGPTSSVLLFDEENIGLMAAHEVASFQFEAEIYAGLSSETYEGELLWRLIPHECVVTILRPASQSTNHSACARRLYSYLQTRLQLSEGLQLVTDAERVGCRVPFSDDKQKKDLHALSMSWLFEERPLHQPVRVAVTHEMRVTMGVDMGECFRERLEKVRVIATSNGVAWKEMVVVSDGKKFVELRLEGLSCDALQCVEAALHGCVESERYADTVEQSASKTEASWKAHATKFFAAGHDVSNKVCFRYNRRERTVWVFGSAAARRVAMHSLKLHSLSTIHNNKSEKPRCVFCYEEAKDPSIVLAACGHTFCVECMQPWVTPWGDFPLRCQAADRGRPFHVDDVDQVVEDIDELVELAVTKYAEKHADKYEVVPRFGATKCFASACREWKCVRTVRLPPTRRLPGPLTPSQPRPGHPIAGLLGGIPPRSPRAVASLQDHTQQVSTLPSTPPATSLPFRAPPSLLRLSRSLLPRFVSLLTNSWPQFQIPFHAIAHHVVSRP